MSQIFYENGGGDEQYTPKEGVEMLLPHIEHWKGKTIWLPFDKQDSQFVDVLLRAGHKIWRSHIEDEDGKGDFFSNNSREHWDLIISNPPYKEKRKYWERCMSFNKPFLLLLPLNILSDTMVNKTMKGKQLQVLIPEKRMKFYNNKTGEIGKSPTFKAVYMGLGVLKDNLILL